MITFNEHRRIQSIIEAHNQHACRRRKHNFLLRGFVFCDICGRRYTAEKHRPKKKTDYYHCTAGTRHNNQGQNIEVKDLERQVENHFRNIQFNKKFIDLVSKKIKSFYEERKSEKETDKRVFLNKKIAIERKRGVAEEKLIGGVLKNDDFIRIRDQYKQELTHIQNEIDELEAQREIDVETVRKVLLLSQNIYRAYKTAPYEIKRLYLNFFWDGFFVRDKKIVQAKPSKRCRGVEIEKTPDVSPWDFKSIFAPCQFLSLFITVLVWKN